MRFRLLYVFLPLLLGACSKAKGPVRLDFIGNTALTSSNRTASPNDTLSTRAYAVGGESLLRRLRIEVTYTPGLSPILYPLPISNFDADNAPASQTLVYLDSLITPLFSTRNYTSPYKGGEYIFDNRFSARSTSGIEQWTYTATDADGQSASRSYRITVSKADSAAVFHNYTVLMRPQPATATDTLRNRARVFLNLRYGLLLPRYAVLNNETTVQPNQRLIDLVCVTNSTGATIRLDGPASDSLGRRLSTARWPRANRNATRLLRTSLTAAQFAEARTTANFVSAFAAGTPFFTSDSLSTGVLAQNNVIAFRTGEGYYGLLLVGQLVPGTSPLLNCSIKVQK
ncbi:hypothetical protein [Hymenobacter arizonensis]|uniref:Uncharacterized protein n=1 Tax=Hymenobacter arizonensis TaxID=1227077 RepID=A0A1I6B6P5_HYMAR|nr:hypothetical protein [Hymenobacter arizonensis]SFQ76579.1 hypothetical protein SAMN04515668_4229 [Hymenobacter arizonensis]